MEPVSEHGKLRQWPKELRDVVLVNEEASKKHGRDDKDRGQHHLNLLVRDHHADQVPEPSERVVDQGRRKQECGELVPKVGV